MNEIITLMNQAQQIVESKPTYKRFIDGTPLSNDIAVWMADFALDNQLNAIEIERLRAELVRKDRLFDMLLIAADGSDNAFYGTLATHFVRGIAQQGIDAPKAQEPYGCDAPKAEEPK